MKNNSKRRLRLNRGINKKFDVTFLSATNRNVKYNRQASIVEYISTREIDDIKKLEHRVLTSKQENKSSYKLIDGKMIKQD